MPSQEIIYDNDIRCHRCRGRTALMYPCTSWIICERCYLNGRGGNYCDDCGNEVCSCSEGDECSECGYSECECCSDCGRNECICAAPEESTSACNCIECRRSRGEI